MGSQDFLRDFGLLLVRTTRSVALTDAGRRLVETTGPAMRQTIAALTEVSAQPGETIGTIRLSVPRAAVPFLITPVLPTFRARHPRIEVEISIDDRLIDIVSDGFDAGVRLSESIQRDMVQVRLTDPFRFVVVGAPEYLRRHGTPLRPEDLLRHECITFRSPTSGALYAWALERGRRTWRVPVRGGLVVRDDARTMIDMAEQGVGLTYTFEPMVRQQLQSGPQAGPGRLRRSGSGLLPLLPQPSAALRPAPSLRRRHEGTGPSPPEMTATTAPDSRQPFMSLTCDPAAARSAETEASADVVRRQGSR